MIQIYFYSGYESSVDPLQLHSNTYLLIPGTQVKRSSAYLGVTLLLGKGGKMAEVHYGSQSLLGQETTALHSIGQIVPWPRVMSVCHMTIRGGI